MESVQSKFDQWFEKNEKQILQDFLQFLKFPSISTDPAYKDNCLQTAEWLRCYLQKIGMTAVLWENPGLPVVFAEYCKAGPSRPTILLYQHYDVQPVDPLDLWQSAPFEPAIKEGKIYARGASDNKGQCFLTITALKGLLQVANDLQINLKLFIEGEEESGGKGTQYVIEKKKEALKADYLFAIDFDLPEKGVPGLTLGFRGLVAFNIECTNAAVDLHSVAHGGIALNPNRILAEILSKLWDEDGRIAIPHFYDEVKVWKKEELEKIDLSFDEQTYRKEFGVGAFSKQKGISHREANWIYPTVEINGMWGGYTGAGFKTVIPAKAFAKISCRLVPEQDPKKIEQLVRDFFR
jgi:acetylornithine deacetylase/succinyl-diaminopimelate desuccinylase-like protein